MNNVVVGEVSQMDTGELQLSKYNRRTLRDEHGQYPAWMNQRAIRKRKAKSRTSTAAVRGRTKVKHSSRKTSRKWYGHVYIDTLHQTDTRDRTIFVFTKAMLHLAIQILLHIAPDCVVLSDWIQWMSRLILWRPVLPYGYNYRESCATLGCHCL